MPTDHQEPPCNAENWSIYDPVDGGEMTESFTLSPERANEIFKAINGIGAFERDGWAERR